MIVDCDGHWYNGWDRIVWKPDAEENAFLTESNLWTGNSVYFQHYVHPSRWQSVFGAPHLLKKMLIERINDEAGFYRKEVDRLIVAGVKFPSSGGKKKTRPATSSGATSKIQVQTMEMAVSIPNFSGEYEAVPATQEGLVQAYKRQKLLTYTYKPAVQFVVRANEAAYLHFGLNGDEPGKIAHWMKGRKWEPWKKTPRSALFNRMVLSNDMALLYRTKSKTEHVSAI